jgi:uroporphyrinogen III methyltransferase/synthase
LSPAASETTTPGTVHFVGAGPGDEHMLTLRATALLGAADLVVATAGVPFRRHCRDDAEIVGPDEAADLDTSVVTARLVAAARDGRRVVRLLPGEPLLDGRAAPEAEAVRAAGVPFEIIPGVSAVTSVPAYAGIPLTGDGRTDVRVLDAADPAVKWEEAGRGDGTLVISNALAGIGDVAKALTAAGRPADTPVALTCLGSTTEQETVVSTLGRLTHDLRHAVLSEPAICVVGDVVAERERLSWFETKPLFGWRVLVPRTKEQAGDLSERLRAYGAVPEEVPTISVEPPRTPQQMDRAVRGLVTGRYQWVAFTSVNAVRAVREKFEEYGLDARAFAGVKVAAVGEHTAAALVAFGIKPDLVPPEDKQSSEGLLEVFPPYDAELDPIDRVFAPRADIATDTLIAGLQDTGWEVDDITAYRTVRAAPPPEPVREAIKGGGFDAVLFTSSSTVRNLVGIAGKPHKVTVIACIGPATAKTAEEFSLRVDVQSPKASVLALADELARYGAQRRQKMLDAGDAFRKPSHMRRGARRKKL